MSRLPSIGVTVCNTRSGLNSSRAAGPWRVCAAPLAAGLALLSRTLGRIRRHPQRLSTLLLIKAANTTGAPLGGAGYGFLWAQKLFCCTLSAVGLAREPAPGRRVNVELSYRD